MNYLLLIIILISFTILVLLPLMMILNHSQLSDLNDELLQLLVYFEKHPAHSFDSILFGDKQKMLHFMTYDYNNMLAKYKKYKKPIWNKYLFLPDDIKNLLVKYIL